MRSSVRSATQIRQNVSSSLMKHSSSCAVIPTASMTTSQPKSIMRTNPYSVTKVRRMCELVRQFERQISTNITSASTAADVDVTTKQSTVESASKLQELLKIGSVIDGFTVISSQNHDSLNLRLYTLKHNRSGADYLHIERNDNDNAFCVAFRTMPRTSNGVAHILEHTVLCGSEKYPVRDPFFLLLKRSLNTFMNAMTRPEATFYPFSTQNLQDYNNLLSVYVDSVFFPLLNELDFKQEGHRVEIKRADDDSESNQDDDDVDNQSFKAPNPATTINVDGNQIDMSEGLEPGDDPMLVMKIIEELGLNSKNMKGEEMEKVMDILSQRLMDTVKGKEIYDEDEPDSEGEVDQTLASADQGIFNGALTPNAYRALDIAKEEEVAALANKDVGEDVKLAAQTEEFDYKTAEITYKGVVFNEMKGDLSDPQSLFATNLETYLYNTSIYKNNSGGEPLIIPSLTWEQLKDFHRYHYHPSNACFMSYGNIFPKLKEIDEVINAKLDQLKKDANSDVDIKPAFSVEQIPSLLGESERYVQPKAVCVPGPASSMGEENRPYKLAFSWICKESPITDIASLSLLSPKINVAEVETEYLFRGAAQEGADINDTAAVENTVDVTPVTTVNTTPDTTFQTWFDSELQKEMSCKAIDTEVVEIPNPTLAPSTQLSSDLTALKTLEAESIKHLNLALEESSLSILSSLLLDNPYSPLYTVLSNPDYGQGMAPTTGCDTSAYTPHFSIGLTGVPEGKVDLVSHEIINALHTVADKGEGISKDKVVAMLHQIELSLKDAQKNFGVGMLQRLVVPFAHNRDMQSQFVAIDHIYRIKESVERYGTLYLRALLKYHLLSNPHRLLFIMKADETFNKTLQETEQKQLSTLRNTLNEGDLKNIDSIAQELKQRQETFTDPSCLPTLTVEDIDKLAPSYTYDTVRAGGGSVIPALDSTYTSSTKLANVSIGSVEQVSAATPGLERDVTYNCQPTNGIVVVRAVIDDVAERLTPYQLSLLPYISLLFGKIGVVGSNYREHLHQLDLKTGGIRISFRCEDVKNASGAYQTTLQAIVNGKSLLNNVEEMTTLLTKSLASPDLTQHVYNVISQYAGSLSTALQENGVKYAILDAQSRIPHLGNLVDHYTSGLPHLQSVTSTFRAILAESSTISKNNSPTVIAGKPVPAGITVSPLLMRLCSEIAETMRCLLCGPVSEQSSHISTQFEHGVEYYPTPTLYSTHFDEAAVPVLPKKIDCEPYVQAPVYSSRGFNRVMVTGDETCLGSPNTKNAVNKLINDAYTVQSVTYKPENSILANYFYNSTAKTFEANDKVVSKPLSLENTIIKNVQDIRASTGAKPVPFISAKSWLKEQKPHLNRPYNYVAVPVQVNSVVMAIPTIDHQHPECAFLMILGEMMTDGILHREIREKGGAYGSFSSQTRTGVFVLGSYRDPRVLGTIDSLRQGLDWAKDANNYTDRQLDEAKLSLFASVDSPEVPTSTGLYPFLRNASQEERQLFRDRLLQCTREDIASAARKYLMFDKGKITVVGSIEGMPENIDADSRTSNGKWNITVMA